MAETVSKARWYWRRLSVMSPSEVGTRAVQQSYKMAWRSGPARHHATAVRPRPGRRFVSFLPPGTAQQVPAAAREALLREADELLAGRRAVLGVAREDLIAPDWFLDPTSGLRAPATAYAFGIDHRSPSVTGDVKQVWELSRHQHLTVLAAAWYLTGDDAYAERAAAHLRSWWSSNPFLSGVHWTSGIEVGLRLISWAWARRLLEGWPGAAGLFEANDVAVAQLAAHQRYLAAFRSVGSSANNHVIAELAGQVTASCAFPWFDESARWRESAVVALQRELDRNTFATGINRELATDYHAFVGELGVLAAAEAAAVGRPLSAECLGTLCRMADAGAAMVDEVGAPPRQGDSDDGRGLVVDGSGTPHWSCFLDTFGQAFGAPPWWPTVAPTVAGTLVSSLLGPARRDDGRPMTRPTRFSDAGMTILRTRGALPEIWCRCDGGPHGFLSIAGHAHADALAIEVRHGGVDVLADPGTYCYHSEPEWRSYFRSTIAHNTIEIAGRQQSDDGGPFMWVRHATTTEHAVDARDGVQSWSATHDGYSALDPPVSHTRTVSLDEQGRTIEVRDRIEGSGEHPLRMAFHLGPLVEAELDGTRVRLSWRGRAGATTAVLQLPGELHWSVHRGETAPILGWYSPHFGAKEATTTLIGSGPRRAESGELVSVLSFGDAPAGEAAETAQVLPASWS